MIYLKTREEIELIRESCLLVCKTLALVAKNIKPGITTIELDRLAETFIQNNGGKPAFLNYQGFPNTLCISVNDTVVHGIPSGNKLKEEDIISVDCGVKKNGFFGDACYTFLMKNISPEKKSLCKATKKALYEGIEKAVDGNRLGAVGNAIQHCVEEEGFSVVRDFVGHGIGRKLHEEPDVKNFGSKWKGEKLIAGMVLAVEPIINEGKKEVVLSVDGWTVRTADKKPSAHYEHTVAVNFESADILSNFEIIEKEIKINKYLWQNSLQ